MKLESAAVGGAPGWMEGIPRGLHIDGTWRQTDRKLQVTNPATGAVVAEVADGSPADAMLALDAAVAAQVAWGAMAPRPRATLLHRAHGLMVANAELFARTMTLESGKPLAEARAEFALSADFFLWFAEQAAHIHGTFSQASNGGFRVVVTHQPVGPALLITPWNFPLLMIVRKAGAALAAGCAVVVKTAQETPLTSALFVQTMIDAGLPPGVLNLIHTSEAAAVSSALMADPRLRKVSFTGSTRVGGILMKQGAQHITSASLELGGDGPFLVLDDADIDLAVNHAVVCKFRNAGQACVAANRIIVDRKVEPEFVAKFAERVRALKVGDGMGEVDVGPMISARQRDRVPEQLALLREAGAEILAGGKPIPGAGFFFEPTVARFDGPNRVICSQELFAPVAVTFAVDGLAEAIAFANDTGFGLASYVFTRDLSRAIAVAERLEFGMVGVNRGIMADPAAPFGGTKASGIGREAGHHGIYEFLEPKYIAVTVDDPMAAAR